MAGCSTEAALTNNVYTCGDDGLPPSFDAVTSVVLNISAFGSLGSPSPFFVFIEHRAYRPTLSTRPNVLEHGIKRFDRPPP